MIRNKSGLFAQNFDARLAGLVIWPDCPLFDNKNPGDLKSIKIMNIDNLRAQQIQGRVFFEGAEAPQAAATQTQRAGKII